MSEILIGTSGYDYNEWAGPVYPEGTPKIEENAAFVRFTPFGTATR